jgi:hypothetical protein
VAAEKAHARLHFQHDPPALDGDHGRELPGPRGEAFERLAFRLRIPLDHAKLPGQRLRRRHGLPFADSRLHRRRIRARHRRALPGALGDHERPGAGAGAFGDLQGKCGQLERNPEHAETSGNGDDVERDARGRSGGSGDRG